MNIETLQTIKEMQKILDHHYPKIDKVLDDFEKVLKYGQSNCLEDVKTRLTSITCCKPISFNYQSYKKYEYFLDDNNHVLIEYVLLMYPNGDICNDQELYDIRHNLDSYLQTIWKAGVHYDFEDIHDKKYLIKVNEMYTHLRTRRNKLIEFYCSNMDVINDTDNIIHNLESLTTLDLFDNRTMINNTKLLTNNDDTQYNNIMNMINDMYRTYRYIDEKLYPSARNIAPLSFLELEWNTKYIPTADEFTYISSLIKKIKYYMLDLGLNEQQEDIDCDTQFDMINKYEIQYNRIKELYDKNPLKSLIMQYVRLMKAIGKTPNHALFSSSDIITLQNTIVNIIDDICFAKELKQYNNTLNKKIADTYTFVVYRNHGYLPEKCEKDYNILVNNNRAMINKLLHQYNYDIRSTLDIPFDNIYKEKLLSQYTQIVKNVPKCKPVTFDNDSFAFDIEKAIRDLLNKVMKDPLFDFDDNYRLLVDKDKIIQGI